MKIASVSRFAWCSIAGLLISLSAHADLQVGLEAGAGYSDNINRVSSDETSETIGVLGFDLLWNEQTRRVAADVMIDLNYFEYVDDTFDSEVVGIADGSVILGLVPERFTWLIQDSFGQAQSDPFSPVTPDTRENLNYFTTGPDLNLLLGSAASLTLFGRYSTTNYEESPLDADRNTYGLVLGRNPSERSQIALNLVSEQIDFDDAAATDYDRESAFVSYEVEGSRTDFRTELGYTWLEPDGGDRSGGLLATISLEREISSSSTLYLETGTQFVDAGDALRGAIGGGGVGGPDITATSDPFESRMASLRWQFLRNRTGFSLGVGWYEDRYTEQTQLDRTRMAYEATFNRRLTPTLDLTLLALLNDEDFENAGVESEELNLLTRLNWQVGRRVNLALSVERSDRDSSLGFGEYVENRVLLTIGYTPINTVDPSGAP